MSLGSSDNGTNGLEFKMDSISAIIIVSGSKVNEIYAKGKFKFFFTECGHVWCDEINNIILPYSRNLPENDP